MSSVSHLSTTRTQTTSSAESISPAWILAGAVTGSFIAGGAAVYLYNRYATAAQSQPPTIITAGRTGTVSAPQTPQLTGRRPSTLSTALRDAVIIVDPISTGANVAYAISQRGVPCIKVASGFIAPQLLLLVDDTIRTDYVASFNHDPSDPYKTVSSLQQLPFNIIGVVSGSELGVEVTDFLSESLGCPTNGTEMTNMRRDKFQMGEAVRRCGVRAVKQARVQSWPECESFLDDLRANPFKIVLKPIRSAGSDNVYLCTSKDDARAKFNLILGMKNQLGFINEAVVVQEYLDGIEYVVDTVSRRGKHKIVAIWEYDKRTVNGFNFVYFGMGTISGLSPKGKALSNYMVKVLDALNIIEGAGHGEVIMTRDGPCLVEVGARCHGCEGTFMPLADRVWGYNQVGTLVSATLSQSEFDAIPDVCGDEHEYGFKVDFVSYVRGELIRIDHLDEMRAMKSFVQFDVLPKVGDRIYETIDCFTAVGSVTLCHVQRSIVEADHQRIRELEKTMFVVKPMTENKEAVTNAF